MANLRQTFADAMEYASKHGKYQFYIVSSTQLKNMRNYLCQLKGDYPKNRFSLNSKYGNVTLVAEEIE